MATANFLEKDICDGINRNWYVLDGEDHGTGYRFNNDTYAICSDGAVLNADGCSLECESDYEYIAVINTIK